MLCPNNYAQIIADVAASLLADDQLGAERQLSEIAYERVPATKRRSVPRALIVRVYRRDCWTCRYCGQQTIFYPVMPLLGTSSESNFRSIPTSRPAKPTLRWWLSARPWITWSLFARAETGVRRAI